MTREQALDVLNLASSIRIRIKRIEEKIRKGRFFCTSEEELRCNIARLEEDLAAMREKRHKAMNVLGGY